MTALIEGDALGLVLVGAAATWWTLGYLIRRVAQRLIEGKGSTMTDEDRQESITVVGGRDGRFGDSEGRSAEPEELPAVLAVLARFPKLLNVYTHAEIAELLRRIESDGKR